MIKKNDFSKKRNVLIALLLFFIFFTDTLYAFRINPEALEKIHFVNIATTVAAAPSSSSSSSSAAAATPPFAAVTSSASSAAEEDAGTDADDEKEEEDTPIPHMVGAAGAAAATPAGTRNMTGGVESLHISSTRKYRDRLFLGEADFSFTLALIKKHAKSHPDLSKYIIATELEPLDSLAQGYPNTFFDHMANLNNLNMVYCGQIIIKPDGTYTDYQHFVSKLECHRHHEVFRDWGVLLTGVNAIKLHEIFPITYSYQYGRYRLQGVHFERIYFNFPMTSPASEIPEQNDYKNTKKLINNFFNSASQIQSSGDRIHITIPCGRLTDLQPYWLAYKRLPLLA